MKRVAIVTLTLFALFISSIHAQVSRSKGEGIDEDVLSRQIKFTEITDTAFAESVAFSLSDAHVPGGVIKITGCEGMPAPRYYPEHNSTLRDTLDFMVQSQPDYYWSMVDGVVTLMPKSGEPALLQTRINRLKVKDAGSIHLPLSELMSLPEVRESITKLGLSETPTFLSIPISLRPDKPSYTVDCKDVTLKEALNAIVRVHGRNVWRYAEKRCNGKTEYSIDFVVDAP